MSIQQTEALTATVHSLGYESVDDFALQKAKEVLQAQIDVYQKEVEQYEEKYGMSFQAFSEKFDQKSEFRLFEREDDEMDWSFAIEMRALYKAKLLVLA